MSSNRQQFNWPSLEEEIDSIVPLDVFKEQLEIFTEGQLKFIDWSNVFVAGGTSPIFFLSCMQFSIKSIQSLLLRRCISVVVASA